MEHQSLNKDTHNTIKTAFLNTIANVCSLVIGMVMIPVITRVISQEDLGIASTFQANRNILVILITLSVYAFIHRAMIEFQEDRKNYIYTISVYCIIMVTAVFFISLPLKQTLKNILSLDDFLFYWLFISILSFALYSIADYYCIFHNYSTVVFVIVLCSGPFAQFLSVGLSYVLPDKKYIGRVIGLDAAYIIISVILLIWLLIMRKKHFQRKYISRTLEFTVPVIPHLLSQMVLTQCDLIMIAYFAGDAASGIYSMGHTVGFLAYSVMGQIMAAWSPWVYRRLEEKENEIVFQNFPLLLFLGLYMTIGLMTVSPELVRIFLTDAYLPCIYIIPPLVAAMFFQFMYGFLYDLEYYYKKPHWIAAASVAAAVLNLVLNYICIKKYGYLAACYTTMASYFVLFFLNFLFTKRLQVERVYNIKYMFFASLTVVLYMAAVLCLLDHIFIRYFLLILITVVLICLEYKKIFSAWKFLKNSR